MAKKKKNKQKDQDDLSFIKKYKAILISLLVFIIPVIVYFMGFSYHSGWLDEFGVSNEFFSRNLEYHFIQGFYVFTGAVFYSFNNLKYVVVFTLYIGLVFFLVNILKIDSLKKFLTRNQRKKSGKDEYTVVDLFSNTYVFTFTIGFVLLIVFILVTLSYVLFGIASSNRGASVAKELKKNFQSCQLTNPNPHNCVYIYDANKQLLDQGVVLAKNESQLLIWNGKDANLHILNNQTITFKKEEQNSKP